MRRLILAATLVALTPLAYAQSSGGMTSPSSSPAAGTTSGMTGGASTAPTPGPLDPKNCGTPDEPKPCGPMPRHALKHYRAKPANAPG
jgi:hypothetical protein